MAEQGLLAMSDSSFSVTILRNPTVYGVSPRMRFDLIINIMTLTAFRDKKILVYGGGLQWRPHIHVKDLSDAFITILEADVNLVENEIFNVGLNTENYQVIQIAEMVKDAIPTATIEMVMSNPDVRNYNLGFDKINKVLGFFPKIKVMDGIHEVARALANGEIQDTIKTRTLEYYKYLLTTRPMSEEVAREGKIF